MMRIFFVLFIQGGKARDEWSALEPMWRQKLGGGKRALTVRLMREGWAACSGGSALDTGY